MAETALSLIPLRNNPALRQLLSLVAVAAAVAVGVAAFMWSQQPGYVTLYGALSDGDAAEITEALSAGGIEYRMDSVSGGILVPASRLREARMSLASQGLPSSASTGFELIREEPGLGVSEFMESARYQHALETELGRTIVSLQPIRSARVHLALPRPSAFARRRKTASASVMVALNPGRQLEPGQVAAIVNLVASSVPQMEASQVTVIDQSGQLLSRPQGDEQFAMTANQFSLVRQIEDRYVARIEQLLLPITGPDRINAQVSVDMDFTSSEETRESYEPGSSAVRSEQIAEESLGDQPGGIPGALSNRPPATAVSGADQDAEASRLSRQSTRNYEIDRTVSRVRQSPGRIRRVTTAVLIGHRAAAAEGAASEAPGDAELQRIESLVREAIGFDAERGDSVSVQSAAFFEPEWPVFEEPPLWEQPTVLALLRQLLGLVGLLLVAFLVLRPALRGALGPVSLLGATAPVSALPSASASAPTAAVAVKGGDKRPPTAAAEGAEELVADDTGAAGAQLIAAMNQRTAFDERLDAVRKTVGEDPKRVAQVVRSWLSDE